MTRSDRFRLVRSERMEKVALVVSLILHMLVVVDTIMTMIMNTNVLFR